MNRIKEIMDQRAMSFTELQALTSISKSTLSPLVNSDMIPSKTKLETLERISEVLQVSITDLLGFSTTTLKDWKINEIVLSSDTETNMVFIQKEKEERSFIGEIMLETIKTDSGKDQYFNILLGKDKFVSDEDLFKIFVNSRYNEVSEFIEDILNEAKLYTSVRGLVNIQYSILFDDGSQLINHRSAFFSSEKKKYGIGKESDDSLIIHRP